MAQAQKSALKRALGTTKSAPAPRHAFSTQCDQPPMIAALVNRVHRKFGPLVQQILHNILPTKPIITVHPAHAIRFADWVEQQAASDTAVAAISLYRFAPMKGPVVICASANLVCGLVDGYYGGQADTSVSRQNRLSRDFTKAEARMADRVAALLAEHLVTSWAAVAALEPVLILHESNPAHVSQIDPADMVMHCVFSVQLGRAACDRAAIEILYPITALVALDALAQKPPAAADPAPPDDPIWRAALEARIAEVRLPLRTVLARPVLSVGQLLALQPGDILPISVPQNVPLLIDGLRFASGSVGEQRGQAAFRISTLATGPSDNFVEL